MNINKVNNQAPLWDTCSETWVHNDQKLFFPKTFQSFQRPSCMYELVLCSFTNWCVLSRPEQTNIQRSSPPLIKIPFKSNTPSSRDFHNVATFDVCSQLFLIALHSVNDKNFIDQHKDSHMFIITSRTSNIFNHLLAFNDHNNVWSVTTKVESSLVNHKFGDENSVHFLFNLYFSLQMTISLFKITIRPIRLNSKLTGVFPANRATIFFSFLFTA